MWRAITRDEAMGFRPIILGQTFHEESRRHSSKSLAVNVLMKCISDTAGETLRVYRDQTILLFSCCCKLWYICIGITGADITFGNIIGIILRPMIWCAGFDQLLLMLPTCKQYVPAVVMILKNTLWYGRLSVFGPSSRAERVWSATQGEA